MFNVSVNDKKNIYRSKPVMNVDTVPKPLTYDYMPEGYPSKSVETVTLMEEQEVTFTSNSGLMGAISPVALDIKQGDKLTVVWDGVSYDVVVKTPEGSPSGTLVFGNIGLIGIGDTEDYPFVFTMTGSRGKWITADTAATHTIKVMRQQVKYTPIDVNYMPEGYPKKDGWSIVWDGNTEGKVTVTAGANQLYKFSDMVLSADDLFGATVMIANHPEMTGTITSDNVTTYSASDDIMDISIEIRNSEYVLLNFTCVKKDNAYAEGITFPEKGLYTIGRAPRFIIAKETITPMSTDFIPKNLNVVFRGELGHAPTSCNVTYNELRDWVERDIPVFAVFIAAIAKFNITGTALLTDSLGFVYYTDAGVSKFFTYKSDGTFGIQQNG